MTLVQSWAEPAAGFRMRAAEAGVDLPRVVTVGTLCVDLDAYLVTLDGEPVQVTPRQVELLALFAATPGRVWSRQLLNWVCWAERAASRRVDVQLCRIRARLGEDLFRNIRDRGWALRVAAAPAA